MSPALPASTKLFMLCRLLSPHVQAPLTALKYHMLTWNLAAIEKAHVPVPMLQEAAL